MPLRFLPTVLAQGSVPSLPPVQLLDNGFHWSIVAGPIATTLALMALGLVRQSRRGEKFTLDVETVDGALTVTTALGRSPLLNLFVGLGILLAAGPLLLWSTVIPRGRADLWCGGPAPTCRVVTDGITVMEVPLASVERFEVASAGRGPAQLRASGPPGKAKLVERWPVDELREHALALNRLLVTPGPEPTHITYDWESSAGEKFWLSAIMLWPWIPLLMLVAGRWTTRLDLGTGGLVRTISALRLRHRRMLRDFSTVAICARPPLGTGLPRVLPTSSSDPGASAVFYRIELVSSRGKRFALTRWIDATGPLVEMVRAASAISGRSGLPLQLPSGLAPAADLGDDGL
jgi:hypothetical protein